MSFETIYLIYPSCRIDRIIPCVSLAKEQADGNIDFIVGYNGPKSSAVGDNVSLAVWFGSTLFKPAYTKAVNLTFRAAVREIFLKKNLNPETTIVGYWSDDFIPSKGWDSKIKQSFSNPSIQVVGAYDGIRPVDYAVTIPFFRLDWLLKSNGGLFWVPHYKYVIDVEPFKKSNSRGEFYFAHDCEITHQHYINQSNTRAKDEVDTHNQNMLRRSRDYQILKIREQQGFPLDWNANAEDEIFEKHKLFVNGHIDLSNIGASNE